MPLVNCQSRIRIHSNTRRCMGYELSCDTPSTPYGRTKTKVRLSSGKRNQNYGSTNGDDKRVYFDQTRRSAILRSMSTVFGLSFVMSEGYASSPAYAGLFGGKEAEIQKYTDKTSSIISEVRTTLAMDRNDEAKGPAVAKLRSETNDWVARYRRDQEFSGRISYSNMYSALNAIAGHYNSFGTTYPLPKKRYDRILQECEVAEKALARGR